MTVRQATYDDLHEIAKVHATCFPNYLSTRIGASDDCFLLSRFYKEYLDDNPELFLVATDDEGKIIGFCMGYYLDKSDQQSNYIRHNRRRVLTRIICLLLKGDRLAWKKLKLKFKKPHYEILDHSLDNVPKSDIGDMLSQCVLPDYRGKGCSSLLTKQYLANMKAHGTKYCLLSMKVGNERAIGFFKKNGFIPYRKIGTTSITYMKEL